MSTFSSFTFVGYSVKISPNEYLFSIYCFFY